MQSNDHSAPESTALSNSDDAAKLRQQRRRMFLRAGAGAVPVTLTLASRPVHAWACNTSSAWGSAQVNPNASVLARNTSKEVADESWTIANWKAATSTRAGLPYPWAKVRTQWNFASQAAARQGFTVAQLFDGGPTPPGLAPTDVIFKLLNDKDNTGAAKTVTDFQKYMIVAKLNAKFIPNVAFCLKSNGVDQLAGMIDGSYQPTNISTMGPWDERTIMKYLTENEIVVPN